MKLTPVSDTESRAIFLISVGMRVGPLNVIITPESSLLIDGHHNYAGVMFFFRLPLPRAQYLLIIVLTPLEISIYGAETRSILIYLPRPQSS